MISVEFLLRGDIYDNAYLASTLILSESLWGRIHRVVRGRSFLPGAVNELLETINDQVEALYDENKIANS